MAVAETGGGATARNTWKILAAIFIVLTIVLGGGLAYVAKSPHTSSHAVRGIALGTNPAVL